MFRRDKGVEVSSCSRIELFRSVFQSSGPGRCVEKAIGGFRIVEENLRWDEIGSEDELI
jgi:hypothetical protein